MFVADTHPVLVLTSGGHRVDVVKVGQERSATTVRKADAEEVGAATGYAIGGTPPFGHARDLPVLIDRHLTGFGEVWAAAGTPATCSDHPADLARPPAAGLPTSHLRKKAHRPGSRRYDGGHGKRERSTDVRGDPGRIGCRAQRGCRDQGPRPAGPGGP